MGRPASILTDLQTFQNKYVRPKQLAMYVDVSIRTIYHHIDKGALRAVKIGGILRIPIADARRYASTDARLSS